MDTNQIYELVNSINAQSMGDSALVATDTASLVAMGDSILSSTVNTEAFLNTLIQRIGRTIISYRAYTNPLSLLAVDNMTFGTIMQKVKVEMPVAVPDVSAELTDGQSIDMYVVAKPVAKQKLFTKRTPYTFYVTIQRKWLREAFTSEDAMGSFISAIYGEVRNALELSEENLGRATIANFIGNMENTQIVNLVTDYNTLTGETVTADSALLDNAFLRYAIGQMMLYSKRMTTMSTLYNAEGEQRHTPIEYQRFMMLADFDTAMATQVEYGAFHTEFIEKSANIIVPYWQSALTPTDIKIVGEDDTDIDITNIVGFIHDRDALGTYREQEEAYVTPLNARGVYQNAFYHVNNLYFNDLSENAILFTLN